MEAPGGIQHSLGLDTSRDMIAGVWEYCMDSKYFDWRMHNYPVHKHDINLIETVPTSAISLWRVLLQHVNSQARYIAMVRMTLD